METLTNEIFASCIGEGIEILTGLVWRLNENTYESMLASIIVDRVNDCMIKKSGKLLTVLCEIN